MAYKRYEVDISLDEIAESGDIEQFLDFVSVLCVGNELLMDITYEPLEVLPNRLIRLVITGDDSEAIKFEQETEQMVESGFYNNANIPAV